MKWKCQLAPKYCTVFNETLLHFDGWKMLVTSKLQQLYVGNLQSLPISSGLFFYEQHWSTFNDAQGDGLSSWRPNQSGICFRKIKKEKRREKRRVEKTLEMMLKASLLTPLVEANS